jgi:hypothetical protein
MKGAREILELSREDLVLSACAQVAELQITAGAPGERCLAKFRALGTATGGFPRPEPVQETDRLS